MEKLILCDDQQNHNATLAMMLEKIVDRHRIDAKIVLSTTRAEDVLRFACSDQSASIYFLDIRLAEEESNTMDGIALGEAIYSANPQAYLVYISAFSQYALDCCHNHAFDFLIKPFSEQQLAACLMATLRDKAARGQGTPLTVTAGSRTIILDQGKILYFKKNREYVTAHVLQAEQNITWRESFSALTARLHPRMFVQCHKSCFVSISFVKEIFWDEGCLLMVDNTLLPMSRRCEKNVRDAIRAGVD